jgi:1-acyl-sn-glycerol-3-phosphate acyltransferase
MFWTITSFLGTSSYIIVFIVPTILAAWLDPTANIPHLIARYWARWTLFFASVTVGVEGEGNIPAGPAVYMSNHASNFDVLAILGYLMVQFRWTVKRELFRIPLFGLAMRECGYIMVDRGNHAKAIESMRIASDKIRSGTSIFIFPEGTRAIDGKFKLPFKKGGFHLALDSGTPVVPITVCGTFGILPKNSVKVTPGKINIRIGKPIETKGHDVETLMQAVYNSIQKGFDER